jgi:hypothetical protein
MREKSLKSCNHQDKHGSGGTLASVIRKNSKSSPLPIGAQFTGTRQRRFFSVLPPLMLRN